MMHLIDFSESDNDEDLVEGLDMIALHPYSEYVRVHECSHQGKNN
jgi:hypothetical protein